MIRPALFFVPLYMISIWSDVSASTPDTMAVLLNSCQPFRYCAYRRGCCATVLAPLRSESTERRYRRWMSAAFSPGIAQVGAVPICSFPKDSANLLDETGRLVSVHHEEQLIREHRAAECRVV